MEGGSLEPHHGGAFDASVRFDHDERLLVTQLEIQRCGVGVSRALERAALAVPPRELTRDLLLTIHKGWFDTTFPEQAGRERTVLVLNRKETAFPAAAIAENVIVACRDWEARAEKIAVLPDLATRLAEAIYAANDLAVRMYDIHPFLDGNTRATFSLRNFALTRTGASPLIYLPDEAAYEVAWMQAHPGDHAHLDALSAEALIAVEERRVRED